MNFGIWGWRFGWNGMVGVLGDMDMLDILVYW
jgi:hypothetical protein